MDLKLKPSSKIKRRYLLLSANSKEEIEKAILDYIGILGWAKATPNFIKNKENIILAINRRSLDDVKSAIELSNLNIKILKISGTLKGLNEEIIKSLHKEERTTEYDINI